MLRGTAIASLLALAVAGPVMLVDAMRTPIEPRELETVTSRLADVGAGARARLAEGFARADIAYPPARIRLAAFKEEGRLDLFASNNPDGEDLRFIKSYDMVAGPRPMRAAYEGPKRAAGDRRVPEGLYALDYLNPNSIEYLSIRIAYPNRFDRERATVMGRGTDDLGGAIMIHGGGPAGTEGCIGVENVDIEELFTLVADGRAAAQRRGGEMQADILIAPRDFRMNPLDHASLEAAGDGSLDQLARNEEAGAPVWTARLHRDIDRSLSALPGAESMGASGTRAFAENFRAVLAVD
ncbi:L,D-transpeptidase family protein [Marivibrio halodurans]|uniref:L,D-transpeptidase family protein n=1 Tax=Marivibrio halodurans TaxID=2039722 RepID=A0A8J7SIS6_9PROT|nr:L,D-transpeptidase family protein [Marivibrio halodurans]MBP5857243.1 L,D-transpeptidase family protein [Marivibrio halodurans]